MPRHNQEKRRSKWVGDRAKPKGSKRPRSFHHGAERDSHFFEAERRFRAAENGWPEGEAA